MAENMDAAVTQEAAVVKVRGVSNDEKKALQRLSACALPDSPIDHGMRASVVKNAFWKPFVDDENSLVYFLNRLADDVNKLISEDARGDTLVKRDEAGRVRVASPEENEDAVNLVALRQLLAAKLDKVTDPFFVYATNGDGKQNKVRYSRYAAVNSLVQRDEAGRTQFEAPKEAKDAVNKEYVDDLIGDVETALDSIIAIQEALIGGEGA